MEATGKPVILTVFESRPRTIRTAVDGARAIVLGYLTGPFGGEAIARVLAGDVNPSGRLPFSYPRNAGAIEHYDRSASGDLGIAGQTRGRLQPGVGIRVSGCRTRPLRTIPCTIAKGGRRA